MVARPAPTIKRLLIHPPLFDRGEVEMKRRFVQLKYAAGFALLLGCRCSADALRPQTTAKESDKGGLAAKYARGGGPL